jgi:hypothetical protein
MESYETRRKLLGAFLLLCYKDDDDNNNNNVYYVLFTAVGILMTCSPVWLPMSRLPLSSGSFPTLQHAQQTKQF